MNDNASAYIDCNNDDAFDVGSSNLIAEYVTIYALRNHVLAKHVQ